MTDRNYLEALEYCKNYHEEAEGLTKHTSPKTTESIIIKQNNLIISLLLSLHKKIDNLDKTKILENKATTSNIETDLKFLTNKLENLSFKDTGKEKITRRLPKEYKFPR